MFLRIGRRVTEPAPEVEVVGAESLEQLVGEVVLRCVDQPAKLTRAIRQEDARTPITVGVIPWAQVWPGAKPVFYAPGGAKHLDFVSIHVYPGSGEAELKKAIDAIAVYDIGKPIVIEETFPLACSMEDMDKFVDRSRERADGWISHYFGYTIEEHEQGAEPKGTGPDAPFPLLGGGHSSRPLPNGASIHL